MVIAVSAISGVLDSLPLLLQQLEQQSFALSGLDHQSIGRLKDEVELIRGAFEQYSTLENPTEFTRQWAQKVREVAFGIEESIDRYINGVGDAGNNVASGGIAGTLSRLAGNLVGKIKLGPAHRRSISDELKLQLERLHVQFLEKPTIMSTTTAQPDLYSPRTTATNTDLQLASRPPLVGMYYAREEVTAMVLDGDSAAGIKVISIVGMPGAGKTTLAKEVYCEIGEHFQHRAFVSVGRSPDALCKILQGLLSDVADGNDRVLYQDAINMDELKLKAIIRDRLQHKRYLFVLDDLWSTEAWQEVWSCFPKNNLGSRIVTTTRIEGVAKACCSSHSDCVFRIPLLNESDSETLFYGMTFGSKNDCPPGLRDASMHILRKCNGLPLAIVNIAAALNKTSPASALKDFEMDSQPNKSTYLHGMKEIFDQSYNDIPPQLKTCLLYLSIFPEKREIRRQRLIRRWIAEGFIDEEHGVDKEETAKNYFDELINRNLIQPVQVDYDGNARSCRVHPAMLDFIVCRSMEENFVTLVHPGAGGRRQDDHTPSSNSAIRWLSVQCKANNEEDQGHGTAAQTKGSAGLSHTRSLSVFGEVGAMPQLKKMEMLRVLDLEDCQGSLDPSIDVLPMLFLLRYLSLRGTDVSRLPPKIGSLRHLETIDIRSTRIQELPPSIVDLHNLVHLLAGMISLPRGVGKLTALRTLSFADIMKSTASAVQELADLTNLMELAIFCSQEYKVNNLLTVLQKLAGHRLRSLIVASSSGFWMESLHSLPTPPRYSLQRFKIDGLNDAIPKLVASSCVNLVEMDINFQELSAEGLSVLESIDSLLRLCLCIVSVEQEQLTFRGFPGLKELCFRCRNLPSLSFSAGSLPMLQQLELNFQECSSSSSQEPSVSGVEYLPSLMQAVVAFPREDVGTKVVADVRKAALVHPKHPHVVVKTGKEVSSVGDTEFEELHRLSSHTGC
ncbi:disease resistance protein Pik-2-like isoform X2 [Miscanthus floridulus]|uniref:disease resistance protein Pik-2-like isoform X2 n=1 Tax=Miscanthus floridulus TaxID=154761 RepID=UPI00345A36D2